MLRRRLGGWENDVKTALTKPGVPRTEVSGGSEYYPLTDFETFINFRSSKCNYWTNSKTTYFKRRITKELKN